ncbi:FAD-binding and (Fe-S)-binding domain-containing protein [Mesorhizobium sp. B2-6-4]|uniref:FAD-binding and (Fe-S)-binding domain-containing protein n=1 Tax=Mesorhizobium sp. B2-6-4 TaxID=2589913 RepID=UPI00112C9677|nr:FAD-binding and (Fe-S)-binding domain-containing protein [Mesorhizobium sp. B2-6-4]TPJ52404.1 FAD-binding oxidoreductase [Mesorhizobium sp. B2-6-4]
MSHVIEVDHARAGIRRPVRRIERGGNGRVRSAFVPTDGSVKELAAALRSTIEGEVRFDDGSRALYATDASNYRQVPIGVVIPRSVDDVVAAMAICRKSGAPMVMRGGGTSLAGQGCNVAVLIDFSKYLNRIVALDPERRLARVEPGCVLDTLRSAAEQHHLTFGPDPATHDHNTLGGMLGNNSCGVHSIMSGRTSDNVEALEILTYDGMRLKVGRTDDAEFRRILAAGGRAGEIYLQLDDFRHRYEGLIRERYPKIPRRVSGYENLDQLFAENGFNVARALVGTESTCVTILEATLELIASPPERVLAVIGFKDVFEAADAVPQVLPFNPIACEGMDDMLVEFVVRKGVHREDAELVPEGKGWLIAEFGADTRDEAEAAARRLLDAFERKGNPVELVADKRRQAKIWELREAALGVTAHVPDWPEGGPGWEDSAVHRDNLGRYLRDLKALFHRHGYEASVYGHFGDGLIHCRIDFDLRTEKGLVNFNAFMRDAADLVVRYGGTLSGEHGDGQARAELLEKMYGPEMIQAFREFKAIWDPAGMMNPGKVVDPYPITSNLRSGPEFHPEEVDAYFAYPEDGGSFLSATRRCVGVGSCRRTDSDKSVMCPSYMATREEQYSTRGRARLLFEMMREGPITDGWKSRAVEQALDLCLGCKGCKSDCPVNTDMATYKAEFRAHHYRGRLRPRAAYSMGLIERWSKLAQRAPWLINALTHAPGISTAAKWVGGIAPERSIPAYARHSFSEWFRRRMRVRGGGSRVMLWPDTFNNYFRPATAIAATELLESLGFDVVIPHRHLCCGRPLYDWGMLDQAKALWLEVMTSLEQEIASGTPLIGLEPACVSAFRDELLGLFPTDDRARRLSAQTFLLTEFLDRNLETLQDLRVDGQALVQIHCHHHAVIKPDAEIRVLKKIGLAHEVMKSGCCGMAGSFGFEAAKYEVSMAAAERVLLPAVRAAPADVMILANGFSCREQIEQGTGRKTLHVAELLATGAGKRIVL